MRDKLLAELKKKYPGLSSELLGFLADKLVPKTTAEDQIQGVIDQLDTAPIPVAEYAGLLQREGDRRATAATATHERTLREKYNFQEKTAPPNPPGPAPEPGGGNDDLKKQFEALQAKVSQWEKRSQDQQIQDAFIRVLGEKKIPVAFARGRAIESMDKLDEVVTEVEKEYNEVKQSWINEGLGGLPAPVGGQGRSDNVEADIKAWAASNKPSTT